jgi:membrane protein implicated in regulation of membrane protease activity
VPPADPVSRKHRSKVAGGALASGLMADWLIWLIVAGVFAVVEVTTLTLVLGMLAVSAAGASVVAALGAPAAAQVAVFAAGSIVLLAVVRPVAKRHRHMPVAIRTGAAALVGRRGTALSEIDQHGGQVRIGGEVWSARSYDETQVIPAGASVDIAQIDGATAVVLPLESS